MGIESDQLVYDYLSRVGDLAQQHQLSSGSRMRLVSALRGEIDRQRSAAGADSPASVRRILGRLGSPDDVVTAAARDGGAGPGADTGTPGAANPGGGRGIPGASGASGPGVSGPGMSGSGTSGTSGAGGAGGAAPGSPAGGSPGRGTSGGAGSGGGRPRGPGAGSRTAPGALSALGRWAGLLQPDGGRDSGAGGSPGTGAPSSAGSPGATGTGGSGNPTPSSAELPGQRVRRRIPRPRRNPAAEPAPPPAVGLPPHLAGLDELGPSGGAAPDVDWWSVEPDPNGAGERVAGFTGGVEIPEILRPPRPDGEGEPGTEAGDGGEGTTEEAGNAGAAGTTAGPGAGAAPRRRWVPRPRRRAAAGGAPAAPGLGNPFLLVAAALLVAGVILGSWLALGLGWLLAYGSRRLTPFEKKLTIAGIPATAVAAGLVWIWGRSEGRWGEPIAEGAMKDVFAGTWPWVLKGAALASALYLVWRARKR
ncbi:hypothetical protein ACIBCM_14180 [Streptomyces sp. NPDC051018]|uniref:hypothetical protein n=1 Tax=Streptomyces sp. NPDC051018 TaxID=3365639 RepID=UPI00378CFC22